MAPLWTEQNLLLSNKLPICWIVYYWITILWESQIVDCGLLVYHSVDFLLCSNPKPVDQEHNYWSAHDLNTIFQKSVVFFVQKT